MQVRYLVWILFISINAAAIGQSSVLQQLDTVLVLEKPYVQPFTNGENISKLRKDEQLSTSLMQAGLNVRTYGTNALATAGLRGSSGNHTLICWNGTPITSPMAGVVDINLVPIEIITSASIHLGGEATQYGSGAIAGMINLETFPSLKPQFSIRGAANVGSYGYLNINKGIALTKGKWASKVDWAYFQATNDFTYEPAPSVVKENKNAKISRSNLIASTHYLIDANQYISAHLWYGQADRQIPPTTVQNESVAFQQDSALRMQVSYVRSMPSYSIKVKSTYQNEDNYYADRQIKLISPNSFQQYTQEAVVSKVSRFGTISTQVTHTYALAKSINYVDVQVDNRLAANVTLTSRYKNMQLNSAVRKEIYGSIATKLVPHLGINYENSNWKLGLMGQRLYRLPTLNEKYWKPGGDDQIKPEEGLALEVNIDGKLSKKVKSHLAIYARKMNQQILWLPSNGGIFKAQNVQNTFARGLESTVEYGTPIGKSTALSLAGHYNLTYATAENAVTYPRLNEGDQLYYTPRHTAGGDIKLLHNQSTLAYQIMSVSSSQGFSEPIAAYQVHNLVLSHTKRIANTDWQLQIAINNIFDHTYFVFDRRPMIGRNFVIGVTWDFTKNILNN